MTRMIKYLIKILKEQVHADDLLDGTLYMKPAAYYHYDVKGRGDIREASISGQSMIYKNSSYPICCFYTVEDADVFDEKITIPEHFINEFDCADGWAVVIEYEPFCERLKHLQTNGCTLKGGKVAYGEISEDLSMELLTSDESSNLFIKPSSYSYQKEYRLVVMENLPVKNEKRAIGGREVDCIIGYNDIKYHLKQNIKDFAKAYYIPELQICGNNCVIKV